MAKKKYLPLYKKWMRDTDNWFKGESMPEPGLCYTFGIAAGGEHKNDQLFRIMLPTLYDLRKLKKDGLNISFWASGSPDALSYHFTPLRQTIVLFMAAMNGEL